ncbi:hypothetical protein [Delftia acidovorans]
MRSSRTGRNCIPKDAIPAFGYGDGAAAIIHSDLNEVFNAFNICISMAVRHGSGAAGGRVGIGIDEKAVGGRRCRLGKGLLRHAGCGHQKQSRKKPAPAAGPTRWRRIGRIRHFYDPPHFRLNGYSPFLSNGKTGQQMPPFIATRAYRQESRCWMLKTAPKDPALIFKNA